MKNLNPLRFYLGEFDRLNSKRPKLIIGLVAGPCDFGSLVYIADVQNYSLNVRE